MNQLLPQQEATAVSQVQLKPTGLCLSLVGLVSESTWHIRMMILCATAEAVSALQSGHKESKRTVIRSPFLSDDIMNVPTGTMEERHFVFSSR